MAETTRAAEPARDSIVKEFEWAITELQKVTEELHIRLAPVTRPSCPSDNLSANKEPVSEVRSRLQDLHATTSALRALIERLEV